MELELRCKHCDRYIGKAFGTVVAELACPNSSCKAGNQFKIVNGDIASDIRHKFLTLPKAPKKKEVEVS
jgi:phage FluMu protein Com